MHKSIDNLNEIKKKIYLKKLENKSVPQIIAVTKTFSMEHISHLINNGHLDFGENKVQEANDKWSEVKSNSPDLKLHMIGKLQTNKVKYAVKLFDYIHSLDSIKLAKKIFEEQNKIKKKLKIFIQVNIGNESQKNGVPAKDLKNFYKNCVKDFDLDIIGLMCLPPANNNPSKYFKQMYSLANELSLKELSMGMSSDYIEAIENGATYIRIGSKIFGSRN
mgnify:FL=1|tara:strand:+ start:1133 stop:1789 length:657 start_codon:yes stop_codon:yes gene_type:complete